MGKSDFEDYCVYAAHSLGTSIESPNNRIVRYDETYEKKVTDDRESYIFSTPPAVDIKTEEQDAMDVFGELFSNIMAGDYSNIPPDFLPSLVEPLENFLEYIHSSTGGNRKSSASK